MANLPERVRRALGDDIDITGWTYQLLPPDQVTGHAAVEAVRSRIGDNGNMRLLFIVGIDQLDPVRDADALAVLANGPEGARLAYQVACHHRALRR